jgi:peptidoglycan/LPS O-acetylase OafA/YrhL
VRVAWSRLGKPQTYAQAWLAAAIIAALLGAWFSALGIIDNWQPPWPQFALICPPMVLVIGGLRSSYDIRRRRASSRDR